MFAIVSICGYNRYELLQPVMDGGISVLPVYCTADEINGSGADLAILSIGSIEQHGPHLPVTTDWEIASALGRELAYRAGGFYVPAFPVGTCREHMGKRGSVWMKPETLYGMVRDVCMSLKEQGFRKIAVLLAHGGLFIIPPLVRELNAAYQPDLMVAKLDILDLWPDMAAAGIMDTTSELHAGECETSLMLFLKPELVHMDKAVDWVPQGVKRSDLNYGSILRCCPDGVWGEPSYATAEKGAKMFGFLVDGLVKEMDRAFDLMHGKEKLGYSWF